MMHFNLLPTNISSKNKMNETGRSMVEILGVLTIIGILSIGALEAFRYAIDKKISNDLWKAVKLHASVVIIDNKDGLKDFADEEEIPVNISDDQNPFEMAASKDIEENGFVVDAYSVTKGVCIRTLEMGNAEVELITVSEEKSDNSFGDEVEFEGDTSICAFNKQRISFYFNALNFEKEVINVCDPVCDSDHICIDGSCVCDPDTTPKRANPNTCDCYPGQEIISGVCVKKEEYNKCELYCRRRSE